MNFKCVFGRHELKEESEFIRRYGGGKLAKIPEKVQIMERKECKHCQYYEILYYTTVPWEDWVPTVRDLNNNQKYKNSKLWKVLE